MFAAILKKNKNTYWKCYYNYFNNFLIIIFIKKKQKKLMFNECLSSDKDKAKLYTQFFRPK